MAPEEAPGPDLSCLTDVGARAYRAVVLEGRSKHDVAAEEGVSIMCLTARVGHATRMLREGRIARRKVTDSARPRTISQSVRLAGVERRVFEDPSLPLPEDFARPATRGECQDGGNPEHVHRPCPFVSCRHHTYLDVNPTTGAIKLNFPHLEVDEMAETCSLDAADRGGMILEEVGAILSLTRERVRQVEESSLVKIKNATGDELGLPPERFASPLGEAG